MPLRRLAKTGTYCILHITVATAVAYALSGDWRVALAIGLIEPVVQTAVFYMHETAWESHSFRERVAYAIRHVRLY